MARRNRNLWPLGLTVSSTASALGCKPEKESLSFKDKQNRMLSIRGTEFQAKKGTDRGKAVTFYRYAFP
jgi:hypothetical protein